MIPPGLERVLTLARGKREQRGAGGDGRLAIADLSPDEALALDALPWPGRRKPFLAGSPAAFTLGRFEAALRAAGRDPRELYAAVDPSRPVGDRPAELARAREGRAEFWRWLGAHPVVRTRGLAGWVARARSAGTLAPGVREEVADALRVLDALPVAPQIPVHDAIDRAVLSARLFDGRPHALDSDERVSRLVLSALQAQLSPPPERPRDAWAAFGVEVDPTSSAVLALNLAPRGDTPLARVIREQHGAHVLLTLAQLTRAPLGLLGLRRLFVCENPSVLRAAERALGPRCPPLVCSGGWPSDAVRTVLRGATGVGAEIVHHGDFDWEGLAIHQHLARLHGAVPWRFDAAAYRAKIVACAQLDLPLLEEREIVGDDPLAAMLAAHRRAVPEELAIDDLLADLRTATR